MRQHGINVNFQSVTVLFACSLNLCSYIKVTMTSKDTLVVPDEAI